MLVTPGRQRFDFQSRRSTPDTRLISYPSAFSMHYQPFILSLHIALKTAVKSQEICCVLKERTETKK